MTQFKHFNKHTKNTPSLKTIETIYFTDNESIFIGVINQLIE